MATATLESSWDVGDTSLYWYRISGICESGTCSSFGKFMTVVAARNLDDLCQIIRDKGLSYADASSTWEGENLLFPPIYAKITALQKYANPVRKNRTFGFVDNKPTFSVDSNTYDPTNPLEDLDFSEIQSCLDVYVTESQISAGVDVSVDDYVYTPSGNPVNSNYVYDDITSPDLTTITDTVLTDCNCPELPQSINLSHNLLNSSWLKTFVNYNKLSFGDVSLKCVDNSKSWRIVVPLRGIGANNYTETWKFTYSWTCSSEDQVWEFDFSILRKVLDNGDQRVTRIFAAIPQEDICNKKQLIAELHIDAKTKTPSFNNTKFIFRDELGFFSTKDWQNFSDIFFNINNSINTSSNTTIFAI